MDATESQRRVQRAGRTLGFTASGMMSARFSHLDAISG